MLDVSSKPCETIKANKALICLWFPFLCGSPPEPICSCQLTRINSVFMRNYFLLWINTHLVLGLLVGQFKTNDGAFVEMQKHGFVLSQQCSAAGGALVCSFITGVVFLMALILKKNKYCIYSIIGLGLSVLGCQSKRECSSELTDSFAAMLSNNME